MWVMCVLLSLPAKAMSESGKSGAQCPLCRCDYDLYLRTPRVVPKCGHTFCEKCINARLVSKATRKAFLCSDCGAEAVIRKTVADDLPKNISILDIVKNLKKFASNDRQEERKSHAADSCPEHLRPLELVCQTCNSLKICSHCALFGDHKAHAFAKEMPASKVDLKELKEIFDIITDSVRETLLPQATGSIKATTRVKVKEGLSKHIAACFRQYHETIRRKEQDLLQEVENIVINEGGIDGNIDKLIKEYDQLKNKYENDWKAAVEGEPTKRVLTFDQTDQYINRCKDLHTNVENLLTHAHHHVDRVISDIGLRIMQTPMFKIQEMPFSLKRTVENFNQHNQQQQELASPEKKTRLKSVTSESKAKSVVDKDETKVNNYLQDRNANRSQNKVAPPKKSRDSYSHIEKSDQQEDFSLLQPGKSDLSYFREQPQKELKELATNKCLPSENRGSLPPKAVRPKIAANITETFDSKTVLLKNQKEEDKQKHSIKDISPAKTMGVINKNKPTQQTNQPPLQQPSSHSLAEQLKFVRPTKQISFQFLSRFQELMVETDRQSGLNCLQLVGADINDTLLLYVLDYLRIKKYRFQIIKLVKNVITDEGLKLLLSALVNDNTTQVLNLTSNQLTPRSLELILLFARQNNILRTIYLTNNKISPFHLKAKKNELQAYELEIII